MNSLIGLILLINRSGFIMSYISESENQSTYRSLDLEEMNWTYDTTFLEQFKRAFKTVNEKQMTENIISESLDFIAKHNKLYENGSLSHRLKANHLLGVLTDELPKINFNNIDHTLHLNNGNSFESLYGLPTEFDWRELGKVTKAKDQAKCNCCYAFVVIASIESAVAIRDNLTIDVSQNQSLDLSEQQIVDCSVGEKYLNNGCNYGFIDDSFQYVIDNGVVSEEEYPYKDRKNLCLEPISANRSFITNFIGMPVHSVEQIKRIILTKGPVIALINNDGIMKTKATNMKMSANFFNHAVVIVGWGQQNGTQHWIIKNSWSENWGEKGFARIEFGVRGVDKYIYYPVLMDVPKTDIYNRLLIFVFIVLAILMFVSFIAILMYCCDRRGKMNAFQKLKP